MAAFVGFEPLLNIVSKIDLELSVGGCACLPARSVGFDLDDKTNGAGLGVCSCDIIELGGGQDIIGPEASVAKFITALGGGTAQRRQGEGVGIAKEPLRRVA